MIGSKKAVLIFVCMGFVACDMKPGDKKPKKDFDLGLNTAEPNRTKGYVAVNDIVKQRIVSKEVEFELFSYFESNLFLENPFADYASSLTKLLGTYQSNGLERRYVGKELNAMSIMLWHIAFSGMARELVSNCFGEQALAMRHRFSQVLAQMCGVSDSGKLKKKILHEFWFEIMKFDAPKSEFDEWYKFLKEHRPNVPKETFLHDAVVSAMLNPYFLVEH